MSEGLNLQTAGRLINYDMPWNLMRVEQRIGRVDRIGASFKDITVTNYFYADTVEQRVYEGIAEDYGDFTDIVGDAAPVLANIEKAIEQLALGDASDESIEKQVNSLKGEVESLNNNAIKTADLGSSPEIIGHIEQPPEVRGETDLAVLETVLTTNPLTAPFLTPVDGADRVYKLTPPVLVASSSFAPNAGTTNSADYLRGTQKSAAIDVTFDRHVSDQSREGMTLLTYGTPELDALLPNMAYRNREALNRDWSWSDWSSERGT